ncbi:MAG: hypothetical protein ACLGHT_13510 [Acidimicrobiia bacterium]
MFGLGIATTAALRAQWRSWLAPDLQPFFVRSLLDWPRATVPTLEMATEHRYTYRAWRVDRSLAILWLDEATFMGMPRQQRAALVRAQVHSGRGAVPSIQRWSDLIDAETLRSQADGRRFVWWPSLLGTRETEVLERVIARAPEGAAREALPSRHAEVATAVWDGCAQLLPGARRLAGSFPERGEPNCFSTVMGAAGVCETVDECVDEVRFMTWLSATAEPGGRDGDAGTVLLWRDRSGAPVHAAVTLGGGWVVEKASAEWWTPRAVRASKDVIRATRSPGLCLERHRITHLAGR